MRFAIIFGRCADHCRSCEIAIFTHCIYFSTGLFAFICLSLSFTCTVFHKFISRIWPEPTRQTLTSLPVRLLLYSLLCPLIKWDHIPRMLTVLDGQMRHWYGRSPVWVRTCTVALRRIVEEKLHSWHEYIAFPFTLRDFKWLWLQALDPRSFWQSGHVTRTL